MEDCTPSSACAAVDFELFIPFNRHSEPESIRFSGRRVDDLRDRLEKLIKTRREYLPGDSYPHRQCSHLNATIVEEYSILKAQLRVQLDSFEACRVEINKIDGHPLPKTFFSRKLQKTLEQRALGLYVKIYRDVRLD